MNARILIVAVALLSAACSSEQVYNATSEWRAQECRNLPVRDQQACQAEARTSYSQNKKAVDEARSGK